MLIIIEMLIKMSVKYQFVYFTSHISKDKVFKHRHSLILLLTAVWTGVTSVEGTFAVSIKMLNVCSLYPAIPFLGIYTMYIITHVSKDGCMLIEATFVNSKQINSVQSLGCIWLFANPWTAAHQASCPSPTPGAYPNSCPLSQWCHPTNLSSVVPFSSRLQSLNDRTPYNG